MEWNAHSYFQIKDKEIHGMSKSQSLKSLQRLSNAINQQSGIEIEIFKDIDDTYSVYVWYNEEVEKKYTCLVKEEAKDIFDHYCSLYKTARKIEYES